MVREKLHSAQIKMKLIYDRRAERKDLSPGDQVLALIPIVGFPFYAKYTCLYTVTENISDLNYFIATPGCKKSKQLCHVNLLKLVIAVQV